MSYLYKEVLPPSGVTHATCAFLTHLVGAGPDAPPAPPNLIVVKTTWLEVYAVRTAPDADSSSSSSSGLGATGAWGTAPCRLELVASLRLNGVVEDVAVLPSRARWSQRDSLLLTFRDAKLSVLNWSTSQHELSTSSLHYFEGDAGLRGAYGPSVNPWPPRVVADPQGRCAAVSMYQHQLALLPAMQSLEMDLMSHDAAGADGAAGLPGGPSSATVGNSYVLDLSKLPQAHVHEVRDLAFLHGTGEPLLLVLHEGSSPTWSGRLRDRRDTMLLCAISISTPVKRHTRIWGAVGLPFNAFKIVPLPHGPGALVLSPSLVMYYSQKGQPLVVCVDPRMGPGAVPPRPDFPTPGVHEAPSVAAARIAREFVDNVHPDAASALYRIATAAPGVRADIGGASAAWLSPTSCLLALRSGQLLAVQLTYDGTAVSRVQVLPQGVGSTSCSAAVALGGHLLFLGAWSGDSRLLRYRLPAGSAETLADDAALEDVFGAPAGKRRRLQQPAADGSVGDQALVSFEDGGERDSGQDRDWRPYGARKADGAEEGGAESEDEVVLDAPSAASVLPDAAHGSAGGDGTQGWSSSAAAPPSPWEFGRLDRLCGWGPVRDLMHMEAAQLHDPAAGDDERLRCGPLVFACTGTGASGALLAMRRGVAADVVADVPLPGVTGMWAVHQAAAEGGAAAPSADAPSADAAEPAEEGAAGQQVVAVKEEVKEEAGEPSSASHQHHAFLLLSCQGRRTMVLEAGDELEEITERVEFIVDQSTVCAGNLFNAAVVCQVCPQGVRLVAHGAQVQHLSLQDVVLGTSVGPASILSASVVDPYVLLRLSNGAALLLVGDPTTRRLMPSRWDIAAALAGSGSTAPPTEAAAASTSSGVVPFPVLEGSATALVVAPTVVRQHLAACCLYADDSGWLGRASGTAGLGGAGPAGASAAGAAVGAASAAAAATAVAAIATAAAADAAAMRAASGAAAGTSAQGSPTAGDDPMDTASLKTEADKLPHTSAGGVDGSGGGDGGRPGLAAAAAAPQHYLVTVGRDGRMQVFHLPSMALVFNHGALPSGQRVLSHQPPRAQPQAPAPAVAMQGNIIVEVRLECFAGVRGGAHGAGGLAAARGVPDAERPILLALDARGNLLAYQAFAPGRGRISFVRLPVDWPTHNNGALTGMGGSVPGISRMSRFDGVCAEPGPSYAGVFVCGAQPVWLVATRGGLRAHSTFVDGPIAAITPFHNVNCLQGFIVSAASSLQTGVLRICQLPSGHRLDTPWASKRSLLRCTPHRLAWVPEMRCLAVITSTPYSPVRPRLPEELGGEMVAAAAYAAAEAQAQSAGREDLWEVRLLEPTTGSTSWRAQLAAGETGVSVRMVYLRVAPGEDIAPFLAVGTSMSFGEDYTCLGRVLLYSLSLDVSYVGNGSTESVIRGTLVYARDFQGPVTTVADFKGFLMVSVGAKLELYRWEGKEKGLIKSAFWDAPLLITSVDAVKDYILLGDVHKGIAFLTYKEAVRQFSQLGKEYDHHDVVAAKILINGNKLLFAYGDAAGTLHTMDFDTKHADSLRGQRLVARGALHLGHSMSRIHSIKSGYPEADSRQLLVLGTLEGGMGILLPVADPAAAVRLAALQHLLVLRSPHCAGLNPRAFRRRHAKMPKALGGGQRFGPPLMGQPETALLDGDLLWHFLSRGRQPQGELAAAVQCSVEQLTGDLEQLTQAMAAA